RTARVSKRRNRTISHVQRSSLLPAAFNCAILFQIKPVETGRRLLRRVGMCGRYFLRIVLLSLFVIASAMAQSAGGATVQGTVKESSGAVIPGATLSITHLDTGVKTSTTSNREGYFVTPALPIGKYKIRCEATGMKAWEQE